MTNRAFAPDREVPTMAGGRRAGQYASGGYHFCRSGEAATHYRSSAPERKKLVMVLRMQDIDEIVHASTGHGSPSRARRRADAHSTNPV